MFHLFSHHRPAYYHFQVLKVINIIIVQIGHEKNWKSEDDDFYVQKDCFPTTISGKIE